MNWLSRVNMDQLLGVHGSVCQRNGVRDKWTELPV